jgi:hypothetical protein
MGTACPKGDNEQGFNQTPHDPKANRQAGAPRLVSVEAALGVVSTAENQTDGLDEITPHLFRKARYPILSA